MNEFKLTQEIHSLIEQINLKYKVKIYNNYDRYLYSNREVYVYIRESQIRQILVDLRDLSTVNYETLKTLCNRWLDGLEPMFDYESEEVLEELKQFLQKVLNGNK
jgi:hypothetical protein